jgi:uncharacterized membrane protein YwaF
MGNFFGKPDYGPAEGAYSWQHLLFVAFLMTSMVLLAILLGLKNKNKEEHIKNRVLIWAAFLIDGFELFKIAFNLGASEDASSWKRDLPLFLCSIQLIVIPLAAFSKGKLREASLDFVFIFGILGAVLGTIGAAQNYNAYPVLSFPNVVSGITHTISGFASLYIVISGMTSMKFKNLPILLIILTAFCVTAYVANVLLDYNYMFLMSHDGTPYVMFYDLVGGHPVFYPMIVVVLFYLYIFAFVDVYNVIKNRKTKKQQA